MTIIFTLESVIATAIVSGAIGAGLGLYAGIGINRFFTRRFGKTNKQEK